jgi:CHAT domain-containing protein
MIGKMPHGPDRDDQLHSLLNLLRSERADEEYQREVLSTAEGRESARLRDRAVALAASDRQEEAHALFLEAVRLHPEADLGAAAGSARHDLGHSFSCRRLGVRIENLLAAERWFRASLACPSRASRPHRAAQTQNSLGLCLRHLAAECSDVEQSAKFLDDAEELLRKASATAEEIGPAGWTLAAGCFVNLGNLLMDQRENVDAALTAYRYGLELHRKAAKIAPGKRDEYDLTALATARAYFRRRRKGDAEKALELVKEVVRDGDGRHIGTARLIAAAGLLATKDGRREEKALEQLEAINFSLLDPENIRHAADLFRRLKKRDQAVALLEGFIGDAIRARSQTKADHAADEAAFRANQAAAVAARLYVEKGDHLAAFFVLENSSALRFIETASTYTWQPVDPVARELLRELRRLQADAAMLDQMASLLERAPREFGRQILSEASARVAARESAEPNEIDALRLLRECASDEDPVARLRRESGALLPTVNRIMAILSHRSPEASATFGPCENVLDRRSLGALLDELPGYVLVRISLAKDLLIVAAWHEKGKIVTRAHRLPIGRDLWRMLENARRPGLGPARGALTAMLERLDLSPALPEGHQGRVVVLPSSSAAFLPLGALGPPGKRLLDRFGSIIWLPSLYPLRSRQDAHPPRERTLIVTPGGTSLRHLAVGNAGSDEVRLDNADATRSQVLDRAATADVVCFYTHGRHKEIEGPSIALTDDIIGPSDLSNRWVGVERVELWACETGVSIPADPLTPPGVDEPFGLDFAFLGVGVRSAIGTLWEVPEIVTAAIVRRYRRHVTSGSDPARALADAQRWWLVEGLPSLLGLLDGRSQQDAIAAFVSSLGGEGPMADALGTLGPRRDPSKPMDASEIQRWREHLTCPVSWAGFRFVGVPDRRPHTHWTDEHARPADEGVKQEVKRLLELAPEAREGLEEWRERELNELTQLTPGSPIASKARDSNDAAHVIACLQYACDLRLVLRHNTMRLASVSADLREVLEPGLREPLHDRDALWTALSDAVEIVEPGGGIPRPPVLDPFTRPARALQDETRSGIDATSWVLGKLCGSRANDEAEARTAAYQAVRMATNRTHVVEATWDQLREGERTLTEQRGRKEEQRFSGMLDPGIVLEHNEKLLRQIPVGQGILALSLADHRGLVGACLWRDERGPGQRLVHIEDPALTELMLDLVRPRESDHTPTGGRCAERRDAWVRLDRWLAPHLHHLWGEGLTTKLHWQVLAPGSLRSLPILGLHASKRRIAACIESLVHIPSLGFSKAPPASPRAVRAACLLASNRDEGDTSFGEAAVETLRRAFRPDVIVDPPELRGRTIVEVDTLEATAGELATLRLYGVGTPESLNTTTAGLRLEGGRALGGHNLARLRLGRCDSVELWACVAGGSDVPTLLRNDGDRLPGLAADFLAAGARGVLDLAWPIPDLVKAVVCEQFGLARSKTKWGPTALRYAVFAVAGLLGEWADRARGASSVPEALALLDSARRWVVANIHHVDPSCIVPFADRGEAPGVAGLTVPMLVEEVTHPSHLAAFRWWGL